MRSGLASLVLLAATSFSVVTAQQSLPQVDLGYEIHQAASGNATSNTTYTFKNIRYAQPPVGDLRFAAPVAPVGRNPVVQNGSTGSICPQAGPEWTLLASQFVSAVLAGNASTFNYTEAQAATQQAATAATQGLTMQTNSEDCLFLDVVVPKTVFDSANNRYRRRATSNDTGAPVIVWIFGGGYTLGAKDSITTGNPSGLINASMSNGGQGVIFVAMNYRLGAMGWLSGPGFQAEGGVANAGLYDQRLAIEWVKNNIHLFGGNPNKITLMGESAGGGSIMHQISAFGGQKPISFQQAIPQSPGWQPISSLWQQETIKNQFFGLLNVTTLAEARKLNSSDIIKANVLQVSGSVYGSFTYGPTVDGVFVPNLPGVSMLNGAHNKNLNIMAGHNAVEGLLFAPPYIQSDGDLGIYLKVAFPNIQQPVIDHIVKVLYPDPLVYNATSLPYRTQLGRLVTLITEVIFTCNTNYMARAWNGSTHNYEFQVPPALHGYDIPYTFATADSYANAIYPNTSGNSSNSTNTTSSGIYGNVARALQGYITNFAISGNPNTGPSTNLTYFPQEGQNYTMMGLNVTRIGAQRDNTANPRCVWWQNALYG